MTYQLAVGAIFKWEPRLPEWLEYHRMLGVEHFYLYDNEEPEPLAAHGVLRPYTEHGVVTRFPWPGEAQQYPAYNDLIAQTRDRTKWLAVIDIDEFLQPLDGRTLLAILDDYDRPCVAGVAPHWCLFGSNGHEQAPELQLDGFTRRGHSNAWANGIVKSIIRPDRVRRTISPHHFWADEGYETITVSGWPVRAPLAPSTPWHTLRVVHYHCRSRAEFAAKGARGLIWAGTPEPNWVVHDLNDVEDLTMAAYAPEVRRRLEVINNGGWID